MARGNRKIFTQNILIFDKLYNIHVSNPSLSFRLHWKRFYFHYILSIIIYEWCFIIIKYKYWYNNIKQSHLNDQSNSNFIKFFFIKMASKVSLVVSAKLSVIWVSVTIVISRKWVSLWVKKNMHSYWPEINIIIGQKWTLLSIKN